MRLLVTVLALLTLAGCSPASTFAASATEQVKLVQTEVALQLQNALVVTNPPPSEAGEMTPQPEATLSTALMGGISQATPVDLQPADPPNPADSKPGEMVQIPAGSFIMGCDPEQNNDYPCGSDEDPLHEVMLDAYSIDKYEVTNAQYAECVTAGGCKPPVSVNSNKHARYFTDPAFAVFPVVNVTWEHAAEYCQWAGKRLPTEAEWEKAARGPQPIAFPWGNTSGKCGTHFSCEKDTVAVGSFPANASPYGVMDMFANAAEWVNDWYDYEYDMTPANPRGPSSGLWKVLRGTSWVDRYEDFTISTRIAPIDSYRKDVLGFRCASSDGN